MSKQAKVLGFALCLYILGFGIIIWQAPWIALGVFIVLWANNVGTGKN